MAVEPVAYTAFPYSGTPGAPAAFLVDLDGTLALRGDRGPYEWDRVGEDAPNEPVILVVRALAAAGLQPVYLSGRQRSTRATFWWLEHHVGVAGPLLMRPDGDDRPDWQVKTELFDAHVRDRYDVKLSLGDRDQVVGLWRHMGITCLQVAPGAF